LKTLNIHEQLHTGVPYNTVVGMSQNSRLNARCLPLARAFYFRVRIIDFVSTLKVMHFI